MKRVLGAALGVFTAIGGFMDIGDLVTDALIGARFGFSMMWVTLVTLIAFLVFWRVPFAQMERLYGLTGPDDPV